jgi:hypothetical protein
VKKFSDGLASSGCTAGYGAPMSLTNSSARLLGSVFEGSPFSSGCTSGDWSGLSLLGDLVILLGVKEPRIERCRPVGAVCKLSLLRRPRFKAGRIGRSSLILPVKKSKSMSAVFEGSPGGTSQPFTPCLTCKGMPNERAGHQAMVDDQIATLTSCGRCNNWNSLQNSFRHLDFEAFTGR